MPTLSLPGRKRWPVLVEALLWSVLALQVLWLAWPIATLYAPTFASLAPAATTDGPRLAGQDPFAAGSHAAPAGEGQWRLYGVRIAASGSSAFLAPPEGAQGAWQVGDEIAPGVHLAQVAPDHVVLDQGGSTTRIDLPDPDAPPHAAPPAAAVPAPATPAPAAEAPSAETLADVDPGKLIASAGLRMAMEAGKLSGYTLLPRGNDALLRAAGLQPGDVLVSVNGQALDPERLVELADQLKSNPRAEIAYRRDGQLRTVTLGSGTP